MTPLRVAVFGCGHLGRIHTRLVRNHPAIDFVGVYDPVAESREATAREFNVPAWADPDALGGRIDAAIVAAPTRFHHESTRRLLDQGVHCLVEKPITSTLAEADDLVACAERRRRVLQVGHVERFNPAWRAVRARLDRPRLVQATRASGYTFRSTDVGVVLDLMIHDLDLVLSLMPDDPVSIQAWGQAVVGPHEDVAYARLQFPDGAVAQLTASRVSFQGQRSMQILGDHVHAGLDFAAGVAKLAVVSPRLRQGELNPDALPLAERTRLRDAFFVELMPLETVPVTPGNAIEEEQRDFFQAIRDQRAPQVSGADARRTLAVAQQILDQIAAAHHDRPANLPYPSPVVAPAPADVRRRAA